MIQNNNTFKILSLLIRDIEPYNINQIARTLKISVGSAHKILKNLEGRNIVNVKELGNALYYSLNLDNNEAVKSSELVLIEDKNKILKENATARIYALDLEKYEAKCIVLFGSILSKEEKANDVDVLFIIKNKGKASGVNKFCLEISKTRTKKIHPLIMLEQDFTSNIKMRNKTILDIVKKCAVLRGEDVFIKAIKNAR